MEQLVAYSGKAIAIDDVLAVLGAADADLLFGTLDAVSAGDARSALLAAARLADSGRDLGRFFGDLEAHARGLLVTQVLGEVPAELSVTPEQDERLAEQAGRVGGAELVRLLEQIAFALRAMKDGADPRTQLELALVKAAKPELEPSVKALQERIARLESRARRPPPPAPQVAARRRPPPRRPSRPRRPRRPPVRTPERAETPAGRAAAPGQAAAAAPHRPRRHQAAPPPAARRAGPGRRRPRHAAPDARAPRRARATAPTTPPRRRTPPRPPRRPSAAAPPSRSPRRSRGSRPSRPRPRCPARRTSAPPRRSRSPTRPPRRSRRSSPPRPIRRPPSPRSRSWTRTGRRPSRRSRPAWSSRWTRFGGLWPAVVESLREETPMLAALLEDCAPASLAGDGLTLAWPESSAFLKRKAEDPANRDLIAKAIRSVTGSSLRLAYELRAEGDPLPVTAVTATPKLSDEDLVQRFKDEFDAEELPPEPEEQT